MSSVSQKVHIKLRTRVTCPHCWQHFAPEEILWVSAHAGLLEDPLLGSDHQQRFLPTRFNVNGSAIDARGMVCQEVACPNCHLSIPRAMLEMPPMFISIMGTPSCGKSYFLASMTWQLRQRLPKYFNMTFGDADPTSNKVLNHYEEEQFFNPQNDQIVKLAKTEEQGDLYDTVRYGDQVVTYPRPFLFALRPSGAHPHVARAREVSRVLCLYDNAGESFEPGKDTAVNPVTRHLARSQALMFCFDPTQDPRFRDACQSSSSDPQIVEQPVTARQETVLHEVGDRVRKHTDLQQDQKHPRPLIVIVTKYDAWWPLLGRERLDVPWGKTRSGVCALMMSTIQETSKQVRQLLWRYSPEIVAAAESFAENVLYVPVSATGRGPERDAATGTWGIRPRDINPMWTEVPLLVTLAKWGGGMIAYTNHPPTSDAAASST